TGYDHVITNSIFYSTVDGGGRPGPDDRAIGLPVLTGGHIEISNNLITGSEHGLFGDASWGRGIWSDGGNGVVLDIDGNTIEYSRTGVNTDMGGNNTVNIDGNTFNANGTAVADGIDANGLHITDNHFQNVGDDFNFRNLTDGVTFDAGDAIAHLTPTSPADLFQDAVVILGGSGNDTFNGTEGSDSIDGNNSPTNPNAADVDHINGHGGDDALYGRGGDDVIDGGAGNDLIDGGTGADQMTGGAGNDTFIVDNA